MSHHLESAEELTTSMADRSPADALRWFGDWLDRRDAIAQEVTTDDLATALEALAAELRAEASRVTAQTPGLDLAASVLVDSAHDVRAGHHFVNE